MIGRPRDAAATRAAFAFAEARGVRPVRAASSGRDPVDDLAVPHAVPAVPFDVPVTDIGVSQPFAEVVAARRSERHLHPPDVTQVGTILARAGLTRSRSTDLAGAPIAHRAAPSAGARHPLTLVLLAGDVRGLDPGSWVLDPDAAVLRRGAHSPGHTAQALQELAQAMDQSLPPPAAVLAVAHPDRTLSRYPDGISLLWRETGALLMLVHLAAADLGLGSCIVGTCGVLHVDDGSGTGPVDLGAVAIGTTAMARSVADSARNEET